MENAIIVKCTHDPRVDHCTDCMPWWETYPICPFHKTKLKRSKSVKDDWPRRQAWCPMCRKQYKLEPEQ